MSEYIHGTDPDEQRRLSRLNELLNEGSLRELRLAPGERVLDVGSGLGQLARAMARRVAPAGSVVGVERSAEQLAEARRLARLDGEEDLVELRQGNALALPLGPDERGTFDVAHARFVLEHLREPLAAVREMVAAVRPGGRIVLADDDHELMRAWPEPPGFGAIWRAYVRTYDRLGNDPIVGRRLAWLLHEAGATPRRAALVFFGSCAGAPEWTDLCANLVAILAQARERIVGDQLLDEDVFDDGMAALRAWTARPDAAFWYAMLVAEGVRPA